MQVATARYEIRKVRTWNGLRHSLSLSGSHKTHDSALASCAVTTKTPWCFVSSQCYKDVPGFGQAYMYVQFGRTQGFETYVQANLPDSFHRSLVQVCFFSAYMCSQALLISSLLQTQPLPYPHNSATMFSWSICCTTYSLYRHILASVQ